MEMWLAGVLVGVFWEPASDCCCTFTRLGATQPGLLPSIQQNRYQPLSCWPSGLSMTSPAFTNPMMSWLTPGPARTLPHSTCTTSTTLMSEVATVGSSSIVGNGAIVEKVASVDSGSRSTVEQGGECRQWFEVNFEQGGECRQWFEVNFKQGV